MIRTGKDYRAATNAVGAKMDCASCGDFAPDWRFQGIGILPLTEGEAVRVTVATCPECGFVRQHLAQLLEEEHWT